jgi:hypothetical protein
MVLKTCETQLGFYLHLSWLLHHVRPDFCRCDDVRGFVFCRERERTSLLPLHFRQRILFPFQICWSSSLNFLTGKPEVPHPTHPPTFIPPVVAIFFFYFPQRFGEVYQLSVNSGCPLLSSGVNIFKVIFVVAVLSS